MKNPLASKQTVHYSSPEALSPEVSSLESVSPKAPASEIAASGISASEISALEAAPQKLPSILPRLIRETRQRLGLTQTQFAAKLGVSFLSVNRWENGHHQPLPIVLKQIELLLQGMGTEGQDLLEQYSAKFIRKD
ncbi:helix-turn-helix domain-containing protein [Leptolyngbya ohadii]|uniref:helix-turn-helix domain-containing protein n=1 Tax=Leptolyngbya ohadii TaxID=1962290 RepID=UPI000B598947|nr:helix-turn-helix transcriptional regulator [Leptolyngbya ohadii]